MKRNNFNPHIPSINRINKLRNMEEQNNMSRMLLNFEQIKKQAEDEKEYSTSREWCSAKDIALTRNLAERYEQTLAAINEEVEIHEQKVMKHLNKM